MEASVTTFPIVSSCSCLIGSVVRVTKSPRVRADNDRLKQQQHRKQEQINVKSDSKKKKIERHTC
jgi:cytochrome c biogenesis protein ResB